MDWVNILGFFAAGAALVFFVLQILQQQRIYKMESAARQEETAARARQLELEEDRLAQELNLFDRYRTTAFALGGEIAAALSSNPTWAIDALANARISGGAYSVFGDRISHFQGEKRFLADSICRLVELRSNELLDNDKADGVILVVDSGTTLFPFFEQLGKLCVEESDRSAGWVHRLLVVTNNIPGIESLIRYGRTKGGSGHESLAVSCMVLPGTPLPAYAAIVGEDAEAVLKSLHQTRASYLTGLTKTHENFRWHVIGLTTGNWIVVRDGVVRPLARGEGHLDFKQALIDAADEVYVVGPLGKIFLNVETDEINDALHYSSDAKSPNRRAYQEVPLSNAEGKTKLVTTCRRGRFILQPHSMQLTGALGDPNNITDDVDARYRQTTRVQDLPHIVIPYERLTSDLAEQVEIEFPHSGTRKKPFLARFFDVHI